MAEIVTTTGVALVGGAGVQDNWLNAGDVVTVQVTFGAVVQAAGTPGIILNIGGTEVQALYAAGSGTNTLSFTYMVLAGQTDLNGIAVVADSLALNGGAITANAVAVSLAHEAAGDDLNLRVDTTSPTVFFAGFPPSPGPIPVIAWHTTGALVTAQLYFHEDVFVTGVPTLEMNIGGALVRASYASGSGTGTLDFNYTIVAGQYDSNGPSIIADSLQLNGGTVTDAAGNAMPLTHVGYDDYLVFAIDTLAPAMYTSPDGTVTNTSNVAVDDDLSVLFTEQMLLGTGNFVLKTDLGAVVETFDVATSLRISDHFPFPRVSVDPTHDLLRGTTYRLELEAGSLTDKAGNALPATVYRFSTPADTITGTADGGVLAGTAANDIMQGLAGNDTFSAGLGNDMLDGGDGLDAASFNGLLSAYTIVVDGTAATVTGPDGSDALVDVERLHFDDFNVALDVEGNAGKAYRLYQAAFDRTPDIGGLGFQMNALDVGWGLVQIAQDFIDSPEFTATYGALDNEAFVMLLYRNVLNRDAEAEGLAFHVNRLEIGVSRAGILEGFSESPENKAALLGVIENGMVYLAA